VPFGIVKGFDGAGGNGDRVGCKFAAGVPGRLLHMLMFFFLHTIADVELTFHCSIYARNVLVVKCRRSNRCASIGRDHKSESLHHTGFTVNGCSHLFTCRTDSTLIFLAPHDLQACDTRLRADIMKLCFSDASYMARRIWSWYQRKPNGSKDGS
jgi:hypothetical protein